MFHLNCYINCGFTVKQKIKIKIIWVNLINKMNFIVIYTDLITRFNIVIKVFTHCLPSPSTHDIPLFLLFKCALSTFHRDSMIHFRGRFFWSQNEKIAKICVISFYSFRKIFSLISSLVCQKMFCIKLNRNEPISIRYTLKPLKSYSKTENLEKIAQILK